LEFNCEISCLAVALQICCYKNLPAVLAGAVVSWPISEAKPNLSEALQICPWLLFVAALWYWIGLKMDRQWDVREAAPCLLLAIFSVVCVTGALIPIGYTGYLPYAVIIWLGAGLAFSFIGGVRHS
jgi:hypothetical protein